MTRREEVRRAYRQHLRRAPTPSGVYGCRCIWCGAYFGSTKQDAEFCSKTHKAAYAGQQSGREAEALSHAEDAVFDRPLSEMTYAPVRPMWAASDPRAEPEPDEDEGEDEEE